MLTALQNTSHPFSLDSATLMDILRHAKPLGHHEDAASLNIGFGFLYYGLVRTLRPRHVVVIGSGYGFSVVCLALGLKDNARGMLTLRRSILLVFTDGPFRTIGGTSQWDDPDKVDAHFRRFGVDSYVTHHRATSEDFFASYLERRLPSIDIAFIDGNHSYTAVRHDFLDAVKQAHRNSYLLLHDTNIYVREMVGHAGVKRWLKRVARHADRFEVIDLPSLREWRSSGSCAMAHGRT